MDTNQNQHQRQNVNVKINANVSEIELITAYAQLVFKTLRNSGTEINDKTIRSEVKMFYEKFRK